MGVFMGANLNVSEDSLDLSDLVQHNSWRAHAPDFTTLFFENGDRRTVRQDPVRPSRRI